MVRALPVQEPRRLVDHEVHRGSVGGQALGEQGYQIREAVASHLLLRETLEVRLKLLEDGVQEEPRGVAVDERGVREGTAEGGEDVAHDRGLARDGGAVHEHGQGVVVRLPEESEELVDLLAAAGPSRAKPLPGFRRGRHRAGHPREEIDPGSHSRARPSARPRAERPKV